MRTRSTSLPIDGWIAPSREFPDKSLPEYPKRKPLATQTEGSAVRHQRTLCPRCASRRDLQQAAPRRVPSKEYPSTGIGATPLINPGLDGTAEFLPYPRDLFMSSVKTVCGGESGAYSHVSFAIEPIQPPIVPLSLFSLQSLHTSAARERGPDRSRRWAAARWRSAAHSSSRSVSLPSSAGSVPSRLFTATFLPARAVLRGTPWRVPVPSG
jgi:hypothetical protein